MNVLPRRNFTTAVVTAISNATGKPVSASEAPDGGGWQGEVGKSDFVPYVVVEPGASQGLSGPVGDPQTDVEWSYTLFSYGDSRISCEWMADQARAAIKNLIKDTVALDDSTNGKCLYAWVQSYGAVIRSGDTPPFYAQRDIVSFDVTPA